MVVVVVVVVGVDVQNHGSITRSSRLRAVGEVMSASEVPFVFLELIWYSFL